MSSKGNYYSLRSQHEKAALYFQRALKLNPRCLGAWTLMGHEYMEMKNTSAAIQAYRSAWKWNQRLFLEEFLLSSQLFFSFPYFRHAIEVNKRDYRAWYGLGQTYEILRMPFYCLYYYRKAHQLRYVEKKKVLIQKQFCKSFFENVCCVYRPNDSRMLVALGESYEKLSQQAEAKKVGDNCQWTIHPFVPDSEDLMLLSGAVLLEGILCWRCRENGSAQTGKVSGCKPAVIAKNPSYSNHFMIICTFLSLGFRKVY